MTGNFLIELDARAWLDWLGLPVQGTVQTIESDVGTVLAEVDKVVRVDGPAPWLAHIELQASRDRRLPSRLLQYFGLLHHRHQMPVESTVVLLRPEADGPEMSGLFERHSVAGDILVTFRFRVVRLWEQPVEDLLRGGLSVLPLAPLAAVQPGDIPQVMRRMNERLAREVHPSSARDLRAASRFLLALRYDEAQIRQWMQEMSWIRESSLYRVAVAEGREEGRELGQAQGRIDEARRLLLELGAERLGPPDPTVVASIQTVSDLATLERLLRGLFTASSWPELLSPLAEG